MKRILILAAMVLMAASCANKKSEMKALVLYYSQNGTTKAVAEEIADRLGADIEAIVPVTPYDGDFMATIERGKRELDGGILPEIQPVKADVQSYDVIFLGFPIWFGVYATPVFTVLEGIDFGGKKIVPFCSFGSGGIDSASRALKEKLPTAEILPGYGVRTARIDAAPAELDRFLKENGFIKGDITPLEPFPAMHPASPEEAAIFDAAVDGYPMLNARAEEVAQRSVPGGTEYLFVAKDLPRANAGASAPPTGTLKVYVLAENGKSPVFTQVIR